MQFTSTPYLLFLPIVFTLYWAMHQSTKAQNALLLVASYTFYGWWDTRLLAIIALMTLATFLAAQSIEAGGDNPKRRKAICILAVSLCVLTLGFFKYFNFFAHSASTLANLVGFEANAITLKIILPAGISFYTFQCISYIVDVYRRATPASRDIIAYAVFIAFFPQLVAGPIERAPRMLAIFNAPRHFCYSQSVEGLRRIMIGLFKKMVIADNCAETVSAVFSSWSSQGSLVLMYTAILFTIEIYCDFSGYSDIAIGSAKLFGIDLSENFRAPYLSKSIAEFWRRWHITLMQWFRDYIYIPLCGGRRHKARNTFIVFALSGLWHGANYTFVLWGIYNAALFAPFRRFQKHSLPSIAMWMLTFICVVVGFTIFRSNSIGDAMGYMVRTFSFVQITALPPFATHSLIAITAAALLMLAEIRAGKDRSITSIFNSMPQGARMAAYIAIVCATIIFGAEPATFIYFQF